MSVKKIELLPLPNNAAIKLKRKKQKKHALIFLPLYILKFNFDLILLPETLKDFLFLLQNIYYS